MSAKIKIEPALTESSSSVSFPSPSAKEKRVKAVFDSAFAKASALFPSAPPSSHSPSVVIRASSASSSSTCPPSIPSSKRSVSVPLSNNAVQETLDSKLKDEEAQLFAYFNQGVALAQAFYPQNS